MSRSSTMPERCDPVEISIGSAPRAVTFSTNGEYLWSGIGNEVQVWQVEDGQQMAMMETTLPVRCLTMSKDGRWVAAGTFFGHMFVWDAETHKQVIDHHVEDDKNVNGVDFSPDSTRLVMASNNKTASIWDMETRLQMQKIPHDRSVTAAKYSFNGNRIATASDDGSVRLWDGGNARLLVDVDVKVTSFYNSGLLWSANHLFVLSNGKIMQLDASTGSLLVEWPVPDVNSFSSIALSKHGKFIAYSTSRTVSFWDMTTHTQRGRVIEHNHSIRSIAISPDDQFIAVGGEDGELMINRLFWITKLDIQVDDAVLEAWKHNRLEIAEASLTAAISESRNPLQLALASRALIYARQGLWDVAIIDAKQSIKIWPSVIGYIAKSVALVGKGERHKAYQACDTALAYSDSTHACFLLLIKAIVVFLAGGHDDAISRVDGLIDMMPSDSAYYVVQAYMFVFLGDLCMKDGDYKSAAGLFERAQAQMRPYAGRALMVVSLISGWKFDDLDTTIRRRLCEVLYATARIKEAGECLLDIVNAISKDVCVIQPIATWISNFLQRYEMNDESDGKTNMDSAQLLWATSFKQRCAGKLEQLGDIATGIQQYDEAATYYSTTLSLNPPNRKDVLMKRGEVHIAKGLWENAIDDVNQVIVLDPSSLWAYENKHAALHGSGRYNDAIHTFRTMLSRISQSPDPDIRERRCKYVDPDQTKAAIRAAIDNAIRDSPLVLINTDSGRLLDRSAQASSFESQPVYQELISAMTTRIDHARIQDEVSRYYRYATFSHKWEDHEPLFEDVIRIVVYDLGESLTHDKLQMFCKIVRELGFHWAWSDTCCINKADHFVLQEALVAMFKWYEGSATTIVLLRGVRYPPKRGDLTRSIWNTRAWTLQEYHASKAVRFYTEDWKPYLDPDIPNHKESPKIIAEMEEATGVSVRALMALRPGLDDIREKLCLASTRLTTRVEDAAYSLLGMFSMSLPVVYGEGDKALGRFLAQLLTSSGDSSILAWTGRSGSFNSCLPASISVFNQPLTIRIPPVLNPIHVEVDEITVNLRSSSLSPASITALHDRLHELPIPSFAGQRLRLPCVAFKLGPLLASQSRSGHVFRGQTALLGTIQIETEEDISRFASLYLIHPWIDFLLDRQPVGSVVEATPDENTDHPLFFTGELPSSPGPSGVGSAPAQGRAARRFPLFRLSFGGRTAVRRRDAPSLHPPSTLAQPERQLRALQVIARLRQPFSALLLTPHVGRVAAYRRVAAQSLITVQVEEITPTILNKLIDSVRTLDVL